ncbi:MAG: CBS domain-containing protein [Christensenellales bacterium]
MVKTQSNARRFINAYNEIDYAIRVQHGFKRSMSFSEVIRKAVPLNYVVRKYEDELVDFGRLRNAIIHQSNDDYVIAEPHDDVVAEIEHISNLITTPPKAIEAVIDKNVLCVQYDVMLRDVVELIATSEYSNIPVYKNGGLIGIANGQRILDEIGKQVAQKVDIDDYLSATTIESVVQKQTSSKYYDVVSKDATIEEVLNIFNENRKLIAILITKGGSLNEPPIGILTATDIISLNKILENY